MSRYSPTVTVFNRTDEILVATWNGQQYDIGPGEHRLPESVAKAAKKQNVVMGSEDPRTGKVIYKVSVKEHNDPLTVLTEAELAGPKRVYMHWGERWDRSKLTGARPSEVTAGDNGIYSARDVVMEKPPQISSFRP